MNGENPPGRVRAERIITRVHARTFFKDFYEFFQGYALFRLLPDGMVGFGHYNPAICEIFGCQMIVALRRPR